MIDSASPLIKLICPAISSRMSLTKSIQVQMPSGYHFGITAASAEIADSFEANKFQLYTAQGTSREEPGRVKPPAREEPVNKFGSAQGASAPAPIDHTPQFQDLHHRLEQMSQHFDGLLQEVKGLGDRSDGKLQQISSSAISKDRLDTMDQRLAGIEKTMRDNQAQFASLQMMLSDSHSSLHENLPRHMSESKTAFSSRLSSSS